MQQKKSSDTEVSVLGALQSREEMTSEKKNGNENPL